MLSAQNFTSNGINYNITDATNHYVETAENRNASGSITIPSTVSYNSIIYTVTSIGASSFQNSTITSVNIPNSVTSIKNSAFNSCYSLSSIEIPNSVTSIGSNAFFECFGLTSVVIPNSVTTIGDRIFQYCQNLTSVVISNKVSTIPSDAFNFCTKLSSVTIPNSVTFIGNSSFYYCQNLTSITIPNSVTFIDAAAFQHSGLTAITLPESAATISSQAFSDCENLTSVTIPSSIVSIEGYVFGNCTSLNTINSYLTTPLSLPSDVFDGVNKSTCDLNVKAGSVDAYKTTAVWKDFTHINGTLTNLNVSDANKVIEFKVYPNPATDFVMIQNAKNIKISKVNITDTNGRIVSTFSHLENGKIDVTKLPKGLYIISIASEKGNENFKLMKK